MNTYKTSTINHIAAVLASVLEAEYGYNFSAGGDRFRHERQTEAPQDMTRDVYVGMCRRTVRRSCPGASLDGRLLEVGYNHEKPRDWAGGRYQEFLDYWKRAAPRPDVVGSSHNLSPEQAYVAWRQGIPAGLAKALAFEGLIRGGHRALGRSARKRRILQGVALRRGGSWNWAGADLLRRMGQLCPELQSLAMVQVRAIVAHRQEEADQAYEASGFTHRPTVAKVRVRDLDWAPIQEAGRALAKGGIRARVLLLFRVDEMGGKPSVRRVQALLRAALNLPEGAEVTEADRVRFLTPAYPAISVEQAVRLFKGETPVQVSGGVLTKAEAHAWLSDGGPHLPTWLAARLGLEGLPHLRAAEVVRWLAEVKRRGGWGQLTRERVAHGPAGEAATYRYLDRIDEIQVEDLAEGVRTSVQAAFERAATRFGEAWQTEAYKDHRILASAPRWWTPPCMSWLLTPHALVVEGRELKHCVGGYAPAVQGGRCFIAAITVRDGEGKVHRSTVELSPEGSVLQHRGESNAGAPLLCQRAVEVFLRRNHLGHHR